MHERAPALAGRYGVLFVLAAFFVAPLLFMVSSSFKPDTQIFEDLRSVRAFLPVGDVSLDNYAAVFQRSALPRYLLNSAIISAITVTLGILVNSLAAFGLQRMTWRGRDLALAFILALLVIPFELTALPLMLIVSGLPWVGFEDGAFVWRASWFDTLHVQIVPFVANAFTIFLFYQFFKDIPEDLDDAARMDGARPLQIYWHVVLPNSGPAIATSAILLFLSMWNQYLWPILVVQGQSVRPVMVGLQQFFGPTNAWGEIMAYATLVTLPVLAVFVAFQRQFVQSVVGAGLKG
ncbi:MAG: carbohydrate ABC transporter permease [Myxococcota bacterium]